MSTKDAMVAAVRESREELDQAIRAYAEAMWALQDELSEEPDEIDSPADNIIGDWVVVAHFTPSNRMARDFTGEILASPQYLLMTPRSLTPHAVHGLLDKGQDLQQEESEIAADLMYPPTFSRDLEDDDDDE